MIQFKSTTAQTLESLDREKSVFFFPVAPLEDHGPHLPLGLDLFEAEEISTQLAEKVESEIDGWKAVVMPSAPLGIDSNTGKLAITTRPHVLRDWLVDGSRALQRVGFKNFVCVTGHMGPKQLSAIEEAGNIIGKKFSLVPIQKAKLLSANSALTSAKDALSNPCWVDPKEHGGAQDTSIGLALNLNIDEKVSALPELSPPSSKWTRVLQFFRKTRSGYWGSPKDGSKEKGSTLINQKTDQIFEKLKPVLKGAPPKSLFRSWYSVILPNRSFFKGWLIVIATVLMMTLWMYLTLSPIFDSF